MGSYIKKSLCSKYYNYPCSITKVTEGFDEKLRRGSNNFLISFRDIPEANTYSNTIENIKSAAHDSLQDYSFKNYDLLSLSRPKSSEVMEGEVMITLASWSKEDMLILDEGDDYFTEVEVDLESVSIFTHMDGYDEDRFQSIQLCDWELFKNFVDGQIKKRGLV